jgi:8-oxo-dGTP diphosphatase
VQTVVLGALVRDGHVLLALRRADKRAYPGVWDLPGGEVEAGESEPAALARELREELGVEVRPGAASHLARVVVAPAGDDEVTLSAWLVREWSGTPTNAAPEEHDDLAWFALDQLPPPVHPPLRAALLAAVRPGG